jgi:hypothetical protein
MKIEKNNFVLYLIIGIVSVVIFHFSYGIEILNPTNIRWLMEAHHDWGTHYLGWAYYRNDAWNFPIGIIESYNYPIGTNIGFTDSIPLFALFFKLFSFLLPDDFQYFGIWLLTCYFLTGFYAIKIFDYYRTNRIYSFIAIIFIIVNPVLIYRGLHPALCAQWLLIGSIYNYIRSSNHNVENVNKSQIVLLFLSSTINPYLTAMVFGFNVIIPFKNFFYDKKISLKKAVLYILLSIFYVIVFWIILGMIEFNNSPNLASGENFSIYSFNLNSFFNGDGFSSIFPSLEKMNPMQYEGYAYIGLGMLILLVVSVTTGFIYFLKKRESFSKKNGLVLLLILCGVLGLFSITNEVTYGKNLILKYPLPEFIQKVGFIFRASGRFIWVIYYLLFFFALLLFSKVKINSNIKLGIILILLGIQIYDIKNLITHRELKSGTYDTPLDDKEWILLFQSFQSVIIYPPFNYNYSMTYPMDYQDICFLALKQNKPVSNAYVARTNGQKSDLFKGKLLEDFKSGIINKNQVYVTLPEHVENFDVLIYRNKVSLRKLNNFIIIYSNQKDNVVKTPTNQSDKEYLDSIINSHKKKKKESFKLENKEYFEENKIKYNFDSFSSRDNILQLRGWAFLKETNNNKGDSIFLVLREKSKIYIKFLKTEKRKDVTTGNQKSYLDDSGFNDVVFLDELEKNKYELGIIIKDKNRKTTYTKTDKIVIVK